MRLPFIYLPLLALVPLSAQAADPTYLKVCPGQPAAYICDEADFPVGFDLRGKQPETLTYGFEQPQWMWVKGNANDTVKLMGPEKDIKAVNMGDVRVYRRDLEEGFNELIILGPLKVIFSE